MKLSIVKSTVILAGMALALAGCGGGGSGGSSAVSYTGLTTAAVVDDSASADTVSVAVLSGAANAGIGNAAIGVGTDNTSTSQVGNGDAKLFGDLAKIAADYVAGGSRAHPTVAGATGTQTYSNPCGGTITVTVTSDGNPVTGSVTFNNYNSGTYSSSSCISAGDYTFNGTVGTTFNFSDTSHVSLLSATLTFSAFSVTASGGTEVLNGSYTLDYVANTLNMSLVYQLPDDKVYRMDNYEVTTDYAGNVITISGRLYHPDYGYVDIATPTAFSYDLACSYGEPNSGVMTLTGIDGSGGAYTVGFAATGCNAYTVSAPYPSGSDFSNPGTYY